MVLVISQLLFMYSEDVPLLRRYVPFSVFIYIDIKMRLFALSTIDVSKEAR